MKKIIVSILLLFAIFGCSCQKEDIKVTIDDDSLPTQLDSSNYLYSKFSLLTYHFKSTEGFDQKVENEESFLLFVYSDTCSGCKLLAPTLKPFVDEGLVLYSIEYANISDKHSLYKAGVTTTPYLVIVEEGKIVYVENVNLSQNDEEANVEWTRKWLNKHIEWGNN